jgi:diadenosine tetraphosphate (Ap4A) HIT family hydrolase
MNCLFCELKTKEKNIIYQDKLVYCIYDNFPVGKGHILVITKRHISDYFKATQAEITAIDKALRHCKELLDKNYQPTGYNIGVNNGVSAGQTIMHLHVHLIPRYDNDCKNPHGGVRGVIPEKQAY